MMLRIAAIALVGGVLSLSLKKDQPAFAFLISTCGAALLLVAVAGQMQPLLRYLELISNYGQGQSARCLLQVLGIALAAQFAADCCRDAGMAAAASGVEVCGRILALLQALPLLQTLLDAFLSFLQ